MTYKPMKKTALEFPARPGMQTTSCTDQVVGDILSGWRYDISGLSPAMRTDYDQHLSECSHCRRRQRIARTIDVLLISVSTLSIVAFLLAAVVIHRVELVTHIFSVHLRLNQTHAVAISLEAVAIAGMAFSALLWVLVAIATPIPAMVKDVFSRRSTDLHKQAA